MKNKLFVILLLVAMLIVNAGSAFAQGSIPPEPDDDPRILQESSFWNSDGSARAEVVKAPGSDPFIPAVNTHSATSMVADRGQIAATSPIVNGNFEQGRMVGWSESSSHAHNVVVSQVPPGTTRHSGSWIAWLGDADNETTTLSQSNLSISSPAGLSLWYWIGSADVCGYDFGYVKVNSSVIHSWNLCESTITSGWVELNVDLNAYSGQTIMLSIEVQTDESYPSGLLIDDVSLYGAFKDVAYGYWAADYIQRLSNAGITGGCGSNMYCPETGVSRDQMAVFLLKGIHGSSYAPPTIGASTGFADVPVTYWAAAWIKQLAAEGITGGCGGGLYCPTSPVTRDQMAIFLLRAKYGASYTPPDVAGNTGFSDVQPTHWAAAWIKQLAAEGITGGCSTGTYCPGSPVTRAQMAVFLVKTFNLP
jgi:hypothetical protein